MGVKLGGMKSAYLILPDLFLPQRFATEVTTDLFLPALKKILGRANFSEQPAQSLEAALCAAFGLPVQNDLPIAAISAKFDGLGAGCWLRADAVNLRLQRDQMLLSQVEVTQAEAQQFCSSLNQYFSGQGMTFYAPHPQRWYVRADTLPKMQTTPLSEVLGCNVRGALPRGEDAPRWHQVFNESQMLLHSHALNEQREARGELPVNSLWLWGGGTLDEILQKNFDHVATDEEMAQMFAAVAEIPRESSDGLWRPHEGNQLLVCNALRLALQAGDFQAWRDALLAFETNYAQPLFAALRAGKLARLQIELLAGENSRRVVLTAADAWRFWRRGKALAKYSMV